MEICLIVFGFSHFSLTNMYRFCNQKKSMYKSRPKTSRFLARHFRQVVFRVAVTLAEPLGVAHLPGALSPAVLPGRGPPWASAPANTLCCCSPPQSATSLPLRTPHGACPSGQHRIEEQGLWRGAGVSPRPAFSPFWLCYFKFFHLSKPQPPQLKVEQ